MLHLQSAFGIFALLAIAWAFGENRQAVSLKQAAIGLFVTVLTAIALIKLPFVAHAFGVINDAVGAISAASRAGSMRKICLSNKRAPMMSVINPGKVRRIPPNMAPSPGVLR